MELNRNNVIVLITDGLKEKGLSARQLEDMAEISRDSVRDFLRGKTYIPRADKLQKLLNILYPDKNFFPS